MEYKGFTASVEYDVEDRIYFGHVTGILDSLNFHGYSTEEAEAMFHQSIDNYLDFLAGLLRSSSEKEANEPI